MNHDLAKAEDLHCAVNIPSEKNSEWYRAVISALDGPAVQVVGWYPGFFHPIFEQVCLLDFGLVATVPNNQST